MRGGPSKSYQKQQAAVAAPPRRSERLRAKQKPETSPALQSNTSQTACLGKSQRLEYDEATARSLAVTGFGLKMSSKELNFLSPAPKARLEEWLEQHRPTDAIDDQAPSSPSSVAEISSVHSGDQSSDGTTFITTLGTSKDSASMSSRRDGISDAEYRKRLESRGVDPNRDDICLSDEHDFVKMLAEREKQGWQLQTPLDDLDDLFTAVDAFREAYCKAKDQSLSFKDMKEEVELFRQNINEVLPRIHMFTVTEADFQRDVNWAKNMNEYFLQSTIMMTAVDRWRLGPKFALSRAELWNDLADTVRLPVTEVDDRGTNRGLNAAENSSALPQSKPDLTMGFATNQLLKDIDLRHLRNDLKTCVRHQRKGSISFPLLIIEAKANGRVNHARLRTLHHASQALWNIWLVMRGVQREQECLENVRIFSMVLTPNGYEARAHRLLYNFDKEEATFTYDHIREHGAYTRDQLCLFVHYIVNDYAEKYLWQALRSALQCASEGHGNLTGRVSRLDLSAAALKPRPRQSADAHASDLNSSEASLGSTRRKRAASRRESRSNTKKSKTAHVGEAAPRDARKSGRHK